MSGLYLFLAGSTVKWLDWELITSLLKSEVKNEKEASVSVHGYSAMIHGCPSFDSGSAGGLETMGDSLI